MDGIGAALVETAVEKTTQPLRLFTLNVSGPSVQRAQRLAAFLKDIDADVIVLTETRATAGTEFLLGSYVDAGYYVASPRNLPSNERGVAVIHRVPGARRLVERVRLPHRLILCRLRIPDPVVLIGAYVPSRDASPNKVERKRRFLSDMLRVVKDVATREDVIVMGDLNVIDTDHQPRYPFFKKWEYAALQGLTGYGLVDAFLALYPGTQAHTWVGRTGHGYRYDYGFLSRTLLPRVVDCQYVDAPRLLRLTDHAGMLLTLSARTGAPIRAATAKGEHTTVGVS